MKQQKQEQVMARTIAIGIQDFEQIITNDYFYVDKTAFIKEMNRLYTINWMTAKMLSGAYCWQVVT